MNSDGQREIVVVGGTDNADTRLNSVEIFNVDTGVWREGEEAICPHFRVAQVDVETSS